MVQVGQWTGSTIGIVAGPWVATHVYLEQWAHWKLGVSGPRYAAHYHCEQWALNCEMRERLSFQIEKTIPDLKMSATVELKVSQGEDSHSGVRPRLLVMAEGDEFELSVVYQHTGFLLQQERPLIVTHRKERHPRQIGHDELCKFFQMEHVSSSRRSGLENSP